MAAFDKIKRMPRMPELIANKIEDQIIRGKLKQGETLPSEAELMQQFGVGKYTIREALRMLETVGLVRVQQGSRKGPVITRPTSAFVSDFLRKALYVGQVSGRFITQFRLALEPSIAEIVASNKPNPNHLLEMEDNIRRGKELYREKRDLLDTNTAFHNLLARATQNPLFIVVINTLLTTSVVVKLVTPVKHKLNTSTLKYHTEIFEAIRAGDPARARNAMQQHLLEIDELWSTTNDQAERNLGEETGLSL
jgi:DNA-binding FadR family transcriptional regulator